ncbi:hypothetical protein BD309DRAFT_724448 [Dichomitus squalens]|nr:hypothetical protein BD309DRAFT_724448 [Dichomitus squalens]
MPGYSYKSPVKVLVCDGSHSTAFCGVRTMLITLTLFFGESVTGARTMRNSLRRSSCTTPLQKALKPHLRLTGKLKTFSGTP